MNGSPEGGAPATPTAPKRPAGGAAPLVAAGILTSRIAGLVRERIIAHYFGTSLHADVFKAALRAPNILQNLLGEGALSASFIPIYSELLERGRREEAGRVAGAVFALLFAVVGALTLIGVLLAPLFVTIFTPGFEGLARELTIQCVRIIFPMTGILVLSAWALGVLNSHRKFFIPYFAPVLWNGAIIATLLLLGNRLNLDRLVVALAWGALAGGALQFLVQLPWVLSLERSLRFRPDTRVEGVRTALRNAGPAILGRGAVQIGSYVDLILGSLLARGAYAALTYAQILYVLPVSLFGMSIAAAELPELSRGRTDTEALARRVNAGLRQMSVFVVPSVVAFIAIGDVLVAGLYQTGRFGGEDTFLVWIVLAAYSLALLASTATRLFSSAFFALHDTRTPMFAAIVRVVLSAAVGGSLMLLLRDITLTGEYSLAVVGLAFGTSVGAWTEWVMLRRSLGRRIGPVGSGARLLARLFAAAFAAAAAGRAVLLLLPSALPVPPSVGPILVALLVVAVFGPVYFAAARLLGVAEASAALDRITRRFRR